MPNTAKPAETAAGNRASSSLTSVRVGEDSCEGISLFVVLTGGVGVDWHSGILGKRGHRHGLQWL